MSGHDHGSQEEIARKVAHLRVERGKAYERMIECEIEIGRAQRACNHADVRVTIDRYDGVQRVVCGSCGMEVGS